VGLSLIIYIIPLVGAIALLYAFIQAQWIQKQDYGTERMEELSGHIREGAQAFLSKEYKALTGFVLVVAVVLGFLYYQAGAVGNLTAGHMALVSISFIVGAICSGLAGYFGMRVATLANVRTTNAAREGLAPGLKVSFAGGTVMGMSVVGLAVLGLGVLMLAFGFLLPVDLTATIGEGVGQASYKGLINVVTGFSLGASSIALFARVGGGIYTKAADVGGDLFGKVEEDLPEDDPRNPASIADAVGDNVGDVAGMGADLFESYVGSIIGAMVLALPWASATGSNAPVFLPLAIAAVGIIISIGCTFLVRVKEGGDPSAALHRGTISAAVLTAIAAAGLVYWAIPSTVELAGGTTYAWYGPAIAIAFGLFVGTMIGLVTEYYTSDHYSPVQEISEESQMGSAPNIIAGISLGMWSAGIPVLLIVSAIGLSYWLSGLYGVGLAAFGMLSTTGIQLAVDAFGPIADNAGGIAEMAELPDEVRDRTDQLDAVGNTTAAIGKGFAIGSAALTALALFTAYTNQANIEAINILEPKVMIGIFIGAVMPFVFSALTMQAVGRSASKMIEELRRQFKEIAGIRTGEGTPEYKKCIGISTEAALREMVAPGVLAIGVAALTSYYPTMLGGVLAGVTTAGVAMAIFMSNAGGAWDNAKKYIEADNYGGKGSEAHKASVVGDTVGDPFKDTAGPSLNILIKLMSVVALVLAPIVALPAKDTAQAKKDKQKVEKTAQVDIQDSATEPDEG
jgi:K(+)-stimulated pyrophosphate-energized sodium pump